MIHDYNGDVVETNVDMDKGVIYLVLTHPEAVSAIEELFDRRGVVLQKIPDEDADVPMYFLSPTKARWNAERNSNVIPIDRQ